MGQKLIEATAGALKMRNTAGDIIFDSDEKLFQATSRVTGTKSVGPWTASYDGGSVITDVNTNTNHFLASVNAACDTVVGAFSVTTSDGRGLHNLGWFNAGGTYLHFFDAAVSSNTICQQFATFTFFASGGSLYLNERVLLRAAVGIGVPANSITLSQVTFGFNLYCGSFV